ncbi:MAG: carbohydrate kinase family protein [Dehalococcoidia bacterium]
MAIVCNGSIAFDHIMTFRDYFKNHILPDKVHMISVSFLVDSLERRHGGCGANISYNLALLGERPILFGAAGSDFGEYRQWLDGAGVDTSRVLVAEDKLTASAFITTDLADNQIIGFYPGAMERTREMSLSTVTEPIDVLLISPNDPPAMLALAAEAQKKGHRYIFDPGQSLPAFSGDDIVDAARGAWIIVGNDYELELIRSKTGMALHDLLELATIVVCTLGENGACLITEERDINVPAIMPEHFADPTGAGDAYRAGLVVSLLRGVDLETAARVAGLMGTYACEGPGPQEHSFTLDQFAARYRKSWGSPLAAELVLAGTP